MRYTAELCHEVANGATLIKFCTNERQWTLAKKSTEWNETSEKIEQWVWNAIDINYKVFPARQFVAQSSRILILLSHGMQLERERKGFAFD